MKTILAAVFAVLLLGTAFAAQYTAYFLPEPAPFSGLNESSPGHFGNYDVLAGMNPPFPYITVVGRGIGPEALADELGYLKNASLLISDCNPSELAGANGTDFICTPSGWSACPQGSVCSFSPEEAAVPAAAPPKAGSVPAPLQDTLGITANSRAAVMKTGGAANEAADSTAAQAQSGISLGQLLQLAGAFLAVIIASYLVLQQRQAQVELQINPQEEKLLDNETRAGIMEELSGADRIPTDLSIKLGKSKATVVEHLTALSSAGFVERVATPGRKYVFYRLTQKGKRALLRRAG